MPDYERLADFAAGSVLGASFELRPDAVVPLTAQAPGPTALGDASLGTLVKGWYVRPDNEAEEILLGESDGEGWKEEVSLFSSPVAGAEIEMASLAFDGTGRPVVAMQTNGTIWVRYWDGAAYQLEELTGSKEAPALVTRSPDGAFAEVVLFYQKDSGSVFHRSQSDGFSAELDAGISMGADEKIWRAIMGEGGRLHLIYSIRDASTGQYRLERHSEAEPYAPSCLETENDDDVVPQGANSIVVWREDGSLTARCSIECDVLIIGAGGDSGDSGRGEDSVFWADPSTGEALDPDTDPIPSAHRAYGGGHGASGDVDATGSGGSGGGGGGASPSNNSMWTQGGGTLGSGQGNPGGGGQSTWGLLDPKRATSGGGGGYGGAGTGGTTLQGSPHQKGLGGGGGAIPVFEIAGPEGGNGSEEKSNAASTGSVPGGGGAGGVQVVEGLIIPAGETIQIRVGQSITRAEAGYGGSEGENGVTGLIAVRITRIILDGEPVAELSGGAETVLNDYRFFTFTADGTLTVTAAGTAEALLVGGGGGGGSDAGGGGGGGEVQAVALLLEEDVSISIGEGGAGGTSGAAGANGGATSIGNLAEARGGGGGAGNGTAAGSDATGGGGHGDEGTPGTGTALRGYGGGAGEGYELAGGGSERHAGGGGGAGGTGQRGATQELTGDPLDDNWGTPSGGAIQPASNTYQLSVNGGDKQALLSEIMSRGEMFAQGRVRCGISPTDVGLRIRAAYTTDEDSDPTGFRPHINESRQDFHEALYLFDLGTWHVMQGFCEDGSQEYAIRGPNGSPRAVSVVRDTQSSTALDGVNNLTFGFYCEGAPLAGPSGRVGDCSHLAGFRTKWLLIGNAPTGGSAEVESEAGDVIATGSESGGEILVDLSMFGDGSSGTGEPVPLPGGWPVCRVKDSGGVVVAEGFGSFFPGGEFDVSGSTLEIREDATGAEPVPVTGLLHYENFEGSSPGPEHGDGGPGLAPDSQFQAVTGVEKFSGGGGAGSTAVLAGAGQSSTEGGGGEGAPELETPGDGDANTGGGGGGSGDSSVDGGDGGSGLVVVRAPRFDFSEIAEPQRFSASAIDQTDAGGVLIDPPTSDEVLSLGDNEDWNALSAFTIVARFQPSVSDSQRHYFGRWDETSGKRQVLWFARTGFDFACGLDGTGSTSTVSWMNGGLSVAQDYIYGLGYDGSDSSGGGNNLNRIKAMRLDSPVDSWAELAWDFFFGSGTSTIPASLATLTGVDELFGHRASGAGDPGRGTLRLLAIKYGIRYTPAELDAMDLFDEENIDPADWDRLYRFEGHIADEAGTDDFIFATEP